MRRMLIIAVVLVVGLLPALPAQATVHEIWGKWCSGKGEEVPPGITGGSNADNFARPLFASGVVQLVPYLDGVLVDFDFDAPQMKITGTGNILQIGPGFYIEEFVLDTEDGYTHCLRLRDL